MNDEYKEECDQYDIKLDMTNESRSHVKIINRISSGATILEFGPAHGAMTKYMQEELGCQVYIVEIDESYFSKAMAFSIDGVCGNASDLAWVDKFIDVKFDYVIFADVLEHLYDPKAVLENAAKLLKDNGSILLSVPNIAHSSVIIDLIQNKFQYRKDGILDNTHIRFFTYNSLLKLIDDAGLVAIVEDAIYNQPYQTEFGNDYSSVNGNADVIRKKDYEGVYQFVLEVIKKEDFDESKINIDKKILRNSLYTSVSGNVYFDTGNGISDTESRAFACSIGEFSMTVSLPEGTKSVRFDPIEGALCVIKNLSVTTDIGNAEWKNINGHAVGEYQVFLTKDPQIVISVNPGTTWMRFEGNITVYADDFFVGFFSRTKQNVLEKEDLAHEVAMLKESKAHELTTLEESKEHELAILRESKEHELAVLRESKEHELAALRESMDHAISAVILSKDQVMGARQELFDARFNAAIHHKQQELDYKQQELDHKQHELNHKQYEIDIANMHYNNISNAFWWRMTKPMRMVTYGVKWMVKKFPLTRVVYSGLYRWKYGSAVVGTEITEKRDERAPECNVLITQEDGTDPNCEKRVTYDFSIYDAGIDDAYPLVSVVMPCYNDGEYLYEAVNSALAQTYPSIELIIINDASTDPLTIELLESLSHPRITVINNSVNQRPSAARNSAIALAKGKYILPLDADDTIDESYISKAVDILEKDDSIGAVYCQANLFGLQEGRWELPDYSLNAMLLDNIVFVTALFRKTDWEHIGGFAEEFVAGMEDYDFWLSMLRVGKTIYQIPEVLFHYRAKDASRTTNFFADVEVIKKTYKYIYMRQRSFFQQHMDTYVMLLRDTLIDKVHQEKVRADEQFINRN